MIHLFLNCSAANSGGSLTYLRNVLPHLSKRSDVRTTVAANARNEPEMGHLPNVTWLDFCGGANVARRFWREQTELPALIRESGADVLISTGNFALRKSPVPQILLSGNSLYSSAEFFRDLRSRRDYRLLLDTRLKAVFARRSITWSDHTVAPSHAFAQDLRRWTGSPVTAIHHGFDHEMFFASSEPLPDFLHQLLHSDEPALRLLLVSPYNYFRNFETLLRAIPLVQNGLGDRNLKLILTCKLNATRHPGLFRSQKTCALIQELGISGHVVELGIVPYHLLHHVYRACDLYVTPAYAETFAHPLVEAMASGLPVVASDLEVHREVCGEAALYFPCFSPQELASQILRTASSPALGREMAASGHARARSFSWDRHLDELIVLANQLASRPS